MSRAYPRLRDLTPWRSIAIETCWSPSVAVVELSKAIEKPTHFGPRGDAPFVGRLEGDRVFVFGRQSAPKGSFLPTLRAVVEPSQQEGAIIRVEMVVNGNLVAVLFVLTVAASLGPPGAFGALGFVLSLFIVWLNCRAFEAEARKAEQLLRAIYRTAPALPAPPEPEGPYR